MLPGLEGCLIEGKEQRVDLFIRLFVEGRPVGDAAIQRTHVDVVEALFREGPFGAGIVDFEVAVARHPEWLCGGEVGAVDLGIGKLVGKLPFEGETSQIG